MRGRRARASGESTKRRGRRIASVGVAAALALGVVTTASETARAEDPPAPTPQIAGCGSRTVKSDLAVPPSQQSTKWMVYDTCSFSDDFDGEFYDSSKWTAQRTAYSGYKSGEDACFVDDNDNIRINNGALELTARKEAAPFACDKLGPNAASKQTSWTSGSLTSTGKFTQAYGRFEIRAKMPATTVPGVQFSWWLYPENRTRYGNPWPSSGELDVMEWYSQYSNLGIPFIHYVGDGGGNPNVGDPKKTNNNCVITNPTDWHTYAIEWSPDAINMIYDGVVCLRNTNWTPTNTDPATGAQLQKPQPFDQPFNLNLTQALGVLSNAFNPTSTPLPATSTVEYAYAWTGHIEQKPTLTLSRALANAIRPKSIYDYLKPRCLICPPAYAAGATADASEPTE